MTCRSALLFGWTLNKNWARVFQYLHVPLIVIQNFVFILHSVFFKCYANPYHSQVSTPVATLILNLREPPVPRQMQVGPSPGEKYFQYQEECTQFFLMFADTCKLSAVLQYLLCTVRLSL
ncbi:hypothetical protein BRADI_2g25413v3 [Brachypodium distachyon]|uniref:Uncharacterized protein n=1 Tax=Brachypodium distachyon TaxID=15368 RepID=A0A0Q3IKD2_BRADI|nr:hypothetical protein BRADI_2g25413v3 [Brachypodium distachyon]